MWRNRPLNLIGKRTCTLCFAGRYNLSLSVSIFGQHRLIVTASDSVPRSFKRIRLVTQEDFFAGYALAARYINHPEAALSVEQCIIDPPPQGAYPYGALLGGTPTETVTVDDAVHRSIAGYVQSMCVGEETARQMSEALDVSNADLEGQQPHYDFNLSVAALLISLCPNITILRVHGIGSFTPLGRFFLQNNYGMLDKPSLRKLKEVQLHPVNCYDEGLYERLDTIMHARYFHRLPNMRLLSLEGLEDEESEAAPFPPKSSPGITKINIGHANIPDKLIGTMIRMPKTLEELSLSNKGLDSIDGDYAVYAETLGKCLLEHKDCLRELDLDVAVNKPYPGVDAVDEFQEKEWAEAMTKWYFVQDQKDGDSGLPLRIEDIQTTREYPPRSIGSMHDFTALTRLSIRIGLVLGYNDIETYSNHVISERCRVISGWDDNLTYETTHVPSAKYRLVDALPPNLEFLRLYGYKRGEAALVDAQVDELLQKKAERFPRLREIEGVDQFLPGVPGTYGADPEDERHWERPLGNLDWVEA